MQNYQARKLEGPQSKAHQEKALGDTMERPKIWTGVRMIMQVFFLFVKFLFLDLIQASCGPSLSNFKWYQGRPWLRGCNMPLMSHDQAPRQVCAEYISCRWEGVHVTMLQSPPITIRDQHWTERSGCPARCCCYRDGLQRCLMQPDFMLCSNPRFLSACRPAALGLWLEHYSISLWNKNIGRKSNV